MSMLSSKCDELRKIADELQNLIGNGHNYTWSGLYCTLHCAQQGLHSAADTIWELRCKLAGMVDQRDEIGRLKAENERLREVGINTTEILVHTQMENSELEAENERLREYVSAIAPVAYNGQLSCGNGVYECEFFNQCYNNEPTKHEGRGCKWVIWARELGIEVNDG